MARGGRLLAVLVVSATCAVAYADGSASDVSPAPKKPLQQPEEEKVAPTGLIIAGVALAAFALLLLVGRRKRGEPHKAPSQLAEVHLLVESDDRATVWTSQSGLKLQTDRLGEVTLNLPVGRHDIHLQVGSEQYTRSISVNRIERMRIPINIAKERIARTKSGDFSAMASLGEPASSGRAARTTDGKALIADLPTPGKAAARAPTSAARAYPDAASQSELGDKLAGLIDVELDSPAKPAPETGVTFSQQQGGPRPATPPKGLDLSLDPGAKGDLGSLDFSELATPPKPGGLTLDLGPLSTGEAVDFDVPLTPPPVTVPQPARHRDDIAALPPPPARPSPLRDVLKEPRPRRESALGNLPARNRPPTSPLEGIVRESPVPERAPVLPKAPARPPPPQLDISLDDIARPQRSGKTIPPPMASTAALLADLPNPPRKAADKPAVSLDFDALGDLGLGQPEAMPMMPAPQAGHYELAPPQAAAPFKKEVTGKVPSVADFSIGDAMPARAAAAPAVELPKITASSVADLSLDEDDVPMNRIPARTSSNRKVPSVADFNLDDSALELSADPVPRAMPKALPPIRAMAPVAARSELDDILAPAGSLPPPATGLLGDRFRKGVLMGGGPLGQLFRGRDETGKRDVMIEEVPRDVTLPAPVPQLAGLAHANLVTFYDHVLDASKGYLVTEVIEGKSLKQMLAERGSMSALEAIGIVDQVCAGLAAAHARNVFHRCVRPACILMAGRTIKLAGFAWSPATRSLLYTAPEVAAGGAPDVRSDLYSIGITLAELLSGHVPAGGMLELPSDVPRSLAGLVRKLMSREPTIRPASAKAVRDAFSTIF